MGHAFIFYLQLRKALRFFLTLLSGSALAGLLALRFIRRILPMIETRWRTFPFLVWYQNDRTELMAPVTAVNQRTKADTL